MNRLVRSFSMVAVFLLASCVMPLRENDEQHEDEDGVEVNGLLTATDRTHPAGALVRLLALDDTGVSTWTGDAVLTGETGEFVMQLSADPGDGMVLAAYLPEGFCMRRRSRTVTRSSWGRSRTPWCASSST